MKGVHVLFFISFLIINVKCASMPRNSYFSINDAFLNTIELSNKYGYRCEEHFVETSDGYILTLHRLTGRLNGPVTVRNAPTVLFMHGILGASTVNILDGEMSPGGILSDYGFDVWMGNFRGNRYSRRHKTLKTNDRKFWNFTYNEMILIDCAAFLDYILNYVDKHSLHYVGYSQSGAMMSLLLAFKPEYNQKIQSMTLLASALIFKPVKSYFFNSMLRNIAPIAKLHNLLSYPLEMFAYSKTITELALYFCGTKSLFFNFCHDSVSSIVGIDDRNLTNTERLKYYVAHFPNGVSSNQLLHTLQCYAEGKSRLFDYGSLKNIKIYKQPKVPDVNFSLIEPPKLVMYGSNDAVITAESVAATLPLLKNVEKVVELKGFNHMHVLCMSLDIKNKLYDTVANFIIRHNNKTTNIIKN